MSGSASSTRRAKGKQRADPLELARERLRTMENCEPGAEANAGEHVEWVEGMAVGLVRPVVSFRR